MMKILLKSTVLIASSVLVMGCATNTPVQNTQSTATMNKQTKQAPRTIQDPRKPHKYSSPVGNDIQPQPATSQPFTYTAPNEDNNRMEQYGDTTLPGAVSSPGTHSIFSN